MNATRTAERTMENNLRFFWEDAPPEKTGGKSEAAMHRGGCGLYLGESRFVALDGGAPFRLTHYAAIRENGGPGHARAIANFGL